MTTPNAGLPGSILSLPRELRDQIWALVVTCQPIYITASTDFYHKQWLSERRGPMSDMLSLIAVCRQTRREILELSPDSTTFEFYGKSRTRELEFERFTITRWCSEAQNIPRTLVCAAVRTRFIFRGYYNYDNCEHIVGPYRLKKSSKRDALCRLQAAVNPGLLVMRIGISYHRWASDYGNLDSKHLCNRGVPLSTEECGFITYEIPVGDAQVANASIEEIYNQKFKAIKSHAEHRLCPIKYENARLISRLDHTKTSMLRVVDHLLTGGKIASGKVKLQG